MINSRTGVPILTVDDWYEHAPPRGGRFQWRDGRSAKELARAWCGDGEPGAPAELIQLLGGHGRFAGAVIEQVIPEYRIRIDALAGEPRNADLAGYGTAPAGRFAISVEAKADEPFGASVAEYVVNAAMQFALESSSRQLERVQALVAGLFRRRSEGLPRVGELRYQLLTATAGAIAHAQSVNSSTSLLLFHEFHTHLTRAQRLADNHRDLDNFVTRFTGSAHVALPAGSIIGPFHVPGNEHISAEVELYLGRIVTHVPPPVELDPAPAAPAPDLFA